MAEVKTKAKVAAPAKPAAPVKAPKAEKPAAAPKEMTVKMAEAVGLFTALDFKTASNWSQVRLQQKLDKIGDVVTDPDAKLADKAQDDLLQEVLETVRGGGKVTVVEAEKAPAAPAKPAAKGAKAAPPVDHLNDPPAKPAKAEKPAPGPKKVGVVAVIMRELTAATAKKPTTKAAILDVLKKEFPERAEGGMKNTVSGLTSWVPTEKGHKVAKDDAGGIWLGEKIK